MDDYICVIGKDLFGRNSEVLAGQESILLRKMPVYLS